MTYTFEVWAPYASSMEVEVDGSRHAMNRQDATAPTKHDVPGTSESGSASTVSGRFPGRWEATVSSDDPEPRYAFYIDGDGPFPDPRAPRLPDGVHGPAQLVQHDSFSWTDDGFRAPPMASAVFYELHIGTFASRGSPSAGEAVAGEAGATAEAGAGGEVRDVSGTFESAAARLPELAELGVTHVEIMPVATSSGERGWGYDGAGLYAPFEAYGGPYGLKLFVNRAHELGVAVCLDCVYNHLGPEGNYLGKFGPYFTDAYNTPWGDAVNFDHDGSDEVRAFVLDNLEQWFKHYHIDAVRLDAVHALYDESAVHIMEDMARRARRLEGELGKPLQLIAESNMNNPMLVTSPEAGGVGLDAQWSDDFHHCVHTLLTGEEEGYYRGFRSLRMLARSLENVYVHSGEYSPARGRHVGRPVGNLPRSRFVHCSQNHDQVGNRAVGDRICHLVSADRAKIAAALIILQPAVPMLFQGEEWAASSPFQFFTDHHDPGLGEAVTKGRCSEFVYFGWSPEDVPDPQAPETFRRSMLDWHERSRPGHREMLDWYAALIALRARSPELCASSCTIPDVQFDENVGMLSFRRGRYLVALRLAVDGSIAFGLDLMPAVDNARGEYGEISGSGWSFERNTCVAGSRMPPRGSRMPPRGSRKPDAPEGRSSEASGTGSVARVLLSCGGAGLAVSDEGVASVLELPEDSLAVVDLLV